MFIGVSSGKRDVEVTVVSSLALRHREMVSWYVYEVVKSLVQYGGLSPSSTFIKRKPI